MQTVLTTLIHKFSIIAGCIVLSLGLTACQHIQIAQSPIPVTADKPTIAAVEQAQSLNGYSH